jgi:hypothetical protein
MNSKVATTEIVTSTPKPPSSCAEDASSRQTTAT